MSPDAPVATTAVIKLALITVKELAITPPKLTEVAPVKLVPLIEIVAPGPPDVGVKDVIVGAGEVCVKPAKDAEPYGVITDTFPELPFPTVAVMVVPRSVIVKLVAATPPKLTAVAPLKFAPFIVTVVPFVPVVGENELITGGPI